MLSYTCSPPGSIVYSKYGHFLSPEEFHLVIVKPHSVSYYLTNQIYESADPDVELPFEATIIGAHMFTLPSRQCSSIALITLDLTLIILSSPFSKEGGQNSEEDEQDIPIERTVCDQIRSTHVIPSKYSPLFASSNNQLFISVYPNSLCVITFSDVNSSVVLEKNEIHFLKFLPRFLYGNSENQKIFSFDTVDNTIKTIDISKVPAALEEQAYDSSSLLFTETIPITDENGKNLPVSYFSMKNDQFLIFSETELIVQGTNERYALPNTSGVAGVTTADDSSLYISFKNGEFSKFDQISKQFSQIALLRPFTSIVPIDNGDVMLFSPTDQPLIFNVDQKNEKFSFSNLMVNCLAQTIVPPSNSDHDQLLVADKEELVCYTEGVPFNSSTITSLNGVRLFTIDDFVLVSTASQTVVLTRAGGDDVSANSPFETADITVGVFKINAAGSDWYVQCCSKKTFAFKATDRSAAVSFEIDAQHAALLAGSGQLLVASNFLSVLNFDGSAFSVSLKIEINDEISSICVCRERFVVVSLWRNLAVFVYDIATGQKLSEFNSEQTDAKFVVRSICESHGFVFFGTSRGDVICATLDEAKGELRENSRCHISTSTITLASIMVNSAEYLCVSSDTTSLVRATSDKELRVVPTSLGATRIVSQAQCSQKSDGDEDVEGPQNSVAVLTDSCVSIGEFGESRIIRVNKKKFESRILRLCSVGQNRVLVLLQNELLVVDTLPFEVVCGLPLDASLSYTSLACFSPGDSDDVIVALCCGLSVVEEGKFSESGKVVFVRNFNEILDGSTINTKGLPTAVTFVNNYLFVAIGATLAKYAVSKELQFTLTKEAPGMMLASELVVNRPTAETATISIVDAFKSVAVFDFELHRVATDFLAKYLVAGCNEGDSSFLATDSRGGVYLMSVVGDRVMVQARMGQGETLTGISPWDPFEKKIFGNCHVFCGTSSKGSVVAFLTRIDQKLFLAMEKLQKAMEAFLVQNGELDHSKYRCIYSPSYRESCTNYVDANFLAGILDFEEDDRKKLIADNGIDNFDAIYEFLGLLEELNIQ